MGWIESYWDDGNIDDGRGESGDVAIVALFDFTVAGTPQIFDSVAFTNVSLGLQTDVELFCCDSCWLPDAGVFVNCCEPGNIGWALISFTIEIVGITSAVITIEATVNIFIKDLL